MLKVTYDVDVDEERRDLLALMLPITRELRRIEEAAAARRGVSMWQYAILSVVDRRPGSNQTEVADSLGYSRNRIIADLDHLQSVGFLTRRPAADRRANQLTITARGRTVMRQIQVEIHREEDELLATTSPTARRALVACLGELAGRARRSNGGTEPG